MSRITEAKEVILTSDNVGESWSAAAWDPRNSSILSVFKNAGVLGHRSLNILNNSYVIGADITKPRIHIWPLNSSSPAPNIRLFTPGKVNALTCTPNGSYIIAAVDEKLFIWQTCNGRLLTTLTCHYQTINCLSVTKDGSIFASGGEDGLIFVWSLFNVLNEDHRFMHTFSDSTLPIKDLQFGHGGARTRLYTISLDRTANIYELGSGILLISLVFDKPLTAVTVNNTESQLFVGCVTGDILQCNLHEPPRGPLHNVNSSNDEIVFKAHKSHVTVLSVSVDCQTLLSGCTEGAVHIWDIVSRQILRTIEHKGSITAAFFAPGFENFRAATFKPSLVVRNFQRVSDDIKEDVIEIASGKQNSSEILDFEFFVPNNADSQEQNEALQNFEHLKEVNERLKKINESLYQYSIECVLNKTHNDSYDGQ